MNDSFFEHREAVSSLVCSSEVLLCYVQAITKELSVIHHKLQFITLFTIHKCNNYTVKILISLLLLVW